MFIDTGKDIAFTVFLQTGKRPTEEIYTAKCELPIEDPENSFCEPEFFRNTTRKTFYREFADAMLTEATFIEFRNKLNKTKSKRCTSAYSSILHPFTCMLSPEALGTYERIH